MNLLIALFALVSAQAEVISQQKDVSFWLLNAQRFLLCIYAANQRQARVALESSGRDVVFRNETQFFPVGQLVPQHFLKAAKPSRLWLEPLRIGDEQLGYFIIEADMPDAQSHLELRHHLSSALSRIGLTRELRRVYAAERAGRVAGSNSSSSSAPPTAAAAPSMRVPVSKPPRP